ncbi:hypothetical protein OSSY52_05320 [Tepiditoga spiralis]|uniref:YprB ribonuclease H-like domain-containing protein n=1 Tax=Tepiditoga spiralis TaxID=2108365 RepID=A0A7G1G253_9BACT|nr:TM0106 family RecB-like putative nuclease [Tepiditoga spiralis]BBE30391.1 hypothetical protein OSSY52_05320 [Tepiditoga spiralis]
MDVLYFENLKKCPEFVPGYKRPGTYFRVKIEDVEIEANYENVEENKAVIIRAGKNMRQSHWIHIYAVYKYFEQQNKKLEEIILELENRKKPIKKIEILNKEKWIKKDILKLKTKEKEPGSHCKFCIKKEQCHAEFFKNKNYLVVPSINKKMISDFEEMEIDPVDIIKSNQIEKFPQHRKKLYNLKSLLKNEPLKIKPFKLPNSYIIFDVESYYSLDFLFGFLNNDEYIPFVFTKKDRKKMKKMIDYLTKENKQLVHYDKHDVMALARISKEIPEYKKKIDKLIKNAMDIYEVILKNYSFPVTSYSLKDISKYYNFNWRTKLNGFAVIIEYNRYLKGETKIMQTILDYNEDDCRATKVLLEEMKKI